MAQPFSLPPILSKFIPVPRLRPAQLEARLFCAAEKVLSEWAQLSPSRLPMAPDRAAAEHWQLGVDLAGPQQGFLSLACKPSFGAMLAVAATGDPGAGSFSHEALIELCRLIRETFLTDGLRQDGRDYLLQSPRALQHEEVPAEAPLAALRINVSGYPLDLRLWLR